MTNPTELLPCLAPCPFCGAPGEIEESPGSQSSGSPVMYRGNCGDMGHIALPWTSVRDEAVAAWNARAMPVAAIPATGWSLVPVEPTDEMVATYSAEFADLLKAIWKHMLSAAPAPVASVEVERVAAAENVSDAVHGALWKADSEIQRLQQLLEGRDRFIVDQGLWAEFVAALSLTTPARAVSREAIAAAIRTADDDFGYSIRLTRLGDFEATYTLTYADGEVLTFDSHEDANEHTRLRRDQLRADAIIALIGGGK